MSGNFLCCSKGVKDPFEVQEGRCDFPHDPAVEKDLISPGGENLLVFLQLRQVPLVLRLGSQGSTHVASGKANLIRVATGLWNSSPVPAGPKSLSGAVART